MAWIRLHLLFLLLLDAMLPYNPMRAHRMRGTGAFRMRWTSPLLGGCCRPSHPLILSAPFVNVYNGEATQWRASVMVMYRYCIIWGIVLPLHMTCDYSVAAHESNSSSGCRIADIFPIIIVCAMLCVENTAALWLAS